MANSIGDTIGDWITKLKDLFTPGTNPAPKPPPNNFKNSPEAPKLPVDDGSYQAPVKGSWKNSGDFSPNRATDARHPNGHMGVDIRAPGGTPVYPIAPGIVTNTGTDPKGGNVVNVKHDKGITSYYAHLGTVAVKKDQTVDKNTVLGTIGDSGNAQGTWPHCHFQVWRNGQIANPAEFFTVPKYTNVTKEEKMWLPGHQEVAKNWKNPYAKNRTASAKINLICEGCDVYLDLVKKL